MNSEPDSDTDPGAPHEVGGVVASGGEVYSDEEAELIAERLAALGYIE